MTAARVWRWLTKRWVTSTSTPSLPMCAHIQITRGRQGGNPLHCVWGCVCGEGSSEFNITQVSSWWQCGSRPMYWTIPPWVSESNHYGLFPGRSPRPPHWPLLTSMCEYHFLFQGTSTAMMWGRPSMLPTRPTSKGNNDSITCQLGYMYMYKMETCMILCTIMCTPTY